MATTDREGWFGGPLRAASLAASLALVAPACSSDGEGAPTTDLRPDSSGQGGGEVVLRGTIRDFSSRDPIAGATLDVGVAKVQTGRDGRYEVRVPKGVFFPFSLEEPQYLKLIQQKMALDGDKDYGDTFLVTKQFGTIVNNSLEAYDSRLGAVSVAVYAAPSCPSIEGATVDIEPKGETKVAYVAGGFPSASLTSAQPGEFPSALAWNTPVGTVLRVVVRHPTCKPAAFPITYDGVRYEETVSTDPGEATAFVRVLLE
jgi:hypothetical protein